MTGMAEDKTEQFLSRWSRRKHDAQSAAASPAPDLAPPLPQQEKQVEAETPLPQLPPVEELTLDSDFSGFLHPKVAQDVKHAALKKLFSDPHFNVMDGLDIYIDDYSKPDPLPADLLAQMRSAQAIFRWARDESQPGESAAAPAAEALDSGSLPALAVDAPPPAAVSEADRTARPAAEAEAGAPSAQPSRAEASGAQNDNKL